MLANMRSALGRGLPEVKRCRAHGHTLSIAGGGPSLSDTYRDLDGCIAAVNGSLKFLLDREIKKGASYFCGVLDAGEHIADMIVADKKVRYYVASICDPSVFEKLKDCPVVLWHPTAWSIDATSRAEALLNELRPDWLAIGGGCTMGLRWLNLGYVLGFRKFDAHGLDSSFRGGSTHAYPDRADSKDRITIAGRETRPNFVAQVSDVFETVARFAEHDIEPVSIKVRGDGLLQDEWKRYRAVHPELPLIACVKTGDKYGPEYVTRLRDGIARHLKVPHEFVCYTDKPVSGVKCAPLPADLPGWWAKIGLFKLKRQLIYFDLDVVITGDLAPLLGWDGFGILKDWWLPMFNSSVMVLTGNEGHIFDRFQDHPHDAMRSCPAGDQQFITRHTREARMIPAEWFPSFKADRCQDAVPDEAMAVVFHGVPKPDECGGWVKDFWI